MSSTDRDKAREVIGNVNNYAEDDGELSISAFGPLSERIATALSEVRRETWEAAIKAAQISVKKSVVAGLDVAAAEILIRRLESAKEKDEQR